MILRFSFLLGFIFSSMIGQFALGHGSDKLGPHKGFIQMPGGFHTEVVPKDKSFNVYLIDAEFKNPTTAESSVEFVLKQKDKEVKGNCNPSENYFSCELPQGSNLKVGLLQVKAIRNKAPGNIAEYKLPLKLEKHH